MTTSHPATPSPAPSVDPRLATLRRLTIMGLGRFGGGEGVVRWLLSAAPAEAELLVTDLKTPHDDPAIGEAVARLESARAERTARSGAGPRLTFRFGPHAPDDFTRTDLVVANPAVPRPWDNPFLRAAAAAGVPVTTEIRLLVERLPPGIRTIGITGTAGKSTTTSMIHHMLRHLAASAAEVGRQGPALADGGGESAPGVVHLGGNLGGSLLGTVFAPHDVVVLELSSGMLHWLQQGVGDPTWGGWSPQIAVVTSFAPNHLDWHGSLEHYRSSKQAIVGAATRTVVLGPGLNVDEWVPAGRENAVTTVYRADDADGSLRGAVAGRLRIPGAHNKHNAVVAALACRVASGGAAAVSNEMVGRALSGFVGLPHRLQLVAETADGCRFYDDSKSTTPEAACLAVSSVSDPDGRPGRVHLIAGGYDKKVDLTPMARLAGALAGLYTIGTVGPQLAARARAVGDPDRPSAESSVWECGALEQAVNAAMDRMEAGDVLLLSPGCASWDQFPNYEVRGDRFAALVRARLEPRQA